MWLKKIKQVSVTFLFILIFSFNNNYYKIITITIKILTLGKPWGPRWSKKHRPEEMIEIGEQLVNSANELSRLLVRRHPPRQRHLDWLPPLAPSPNVVVVGRGDPGVGGINQIPTTQNLGWPNRELNIQYRFFFLAIGWTFVTPQLYGSLNTNPKFDDIYVAINIILFFLNSFRKQGLREV